MTLVERLTQEINQKKTRSAWQRGVKEYALELLESLGEQINYTKKEPNNTTELKAMLSNSNELWLDIQARALYQAAFWITKAYNAIKKVK